MRTKHNGTTASKYGIEEFGGITHFSHSLVPRLECSDWLRSPEETSQPLDGFLVQPCRVE